MTKSVVWGIWRKFGKNVEAKKNEYTCILNKQKPFFLTVRIGSGGLRVARSGPGKPFRLPRACKMSLSPVSRNSNISVTRTFLSKYMYILKEKAVRPRSHSAS
jgi:hypothetical protein